MDIFYLCLKYHLGNKIYLDNHVLRLLHLINLILLIKKHPVQQVHYVFPLEAYDTSTQNKF